MTKCCGRGTVGVNLHLSCFSHACHACVQIMFQKICIVRMHLQDREFLHVLKDADIETANESGAACNSQAGPCSYSRGVHFLGLSGIYDVLDADM